MDTLEKINILNLYSKFKKQFEIRVAGESMNPILHDGDIITVCRKDNYQLGDILVFIYKNNEVLVHRLLKVHHNQFYCKGDNSFRLENFDEEKVIGSVVLDFDRNNNPEFIRDSLLISKLFRHSKYNTEIIKSLPEYLEYRKKYLEYTGEI